DAIAHEREAVRRQPGFAVALERLAWLLATAADPGLRQPAEAVALAERARAMAGPPEPAVLDTLAAAYAAAGRFEAAVETAEQAFLLARTAGRGEVADAIEARIALYRTRTAYRE